MRGWANERTAWWAVVAFLAQPLIIFTSGQASADGLSLVFALWASYGLIRLVECGGWKWWLVATVAGVLSASAKLPLYFASGVFSAVYLAWTNPWDKRRWGLLIASGVIASGFFFAWNRACEGILTQADFPFVNLSLKDNPTMWRWYFGDWAYRLDPANYIKAGWAALNVLLGSFALVAVVVAGLKMRCRMGPLAALAGAVVTTMIFSHLVLVHRHDYVLFSLPVALLLGHGIAILERAIAGDGEMKKILFSATALGALTLAGIQGLMGMEIVQNYDPYPKAMAELIQKHSGPEDKILIQGGGWGGNTLMLAGLPGLTIWTDKVLDEPSKIAELKKMGFTKLVMLSESPLLWSLKKTNPGAADLDRESYRKTWSPLIDVWPTEVETEDILIKTIP